MKNTEHALISAESVIEASVDAIVCTDENDIVTRWNAAATRMFGYARDEVLGRPSTLVMPVEDREAHTRGVRRFVETGAPRLIGKTIEVEGLRKNGERFPVELSLSAGLVDGRWTFTAIMRDITLRKNVEKRVLWQNAKLREANDHLHVLHEVSKVINANLDLHTLLEEVLATITGMDVFDVERQGGIFLVEAGKMRVVADLGHDRAFFDAHRDMAVGDCLCGGAALSGEVTVSECSETDSRHTIRYPGMTPHGHIIVPLKAKGDVLGVMYLYLPANTSVSGEKLDLFKSVGMQLGVAISNALLYEQTRTLALQDPLTMLANRRLMGIMLDRFLAVSRRSATPLSVILIDIDHFKAFNDTRGHVAGDSLLKFLANILLDSVRESDLVVRYGGEEFVVLLPETNRETAGEVAERIRRAVEEKTDITISLGVNTRQGDAAGTDGLIRDADLALYAAKKNGRNRVELAA